MQTDQYLAHAYAQTAVERDSARKATAYLAGACVALFLALLYVASKDPPSVRPPPCNAPGVMSLEPTDIRASREQAVWL